MKLNVGDWVIHGYEIAQITKMEDSRVREVSTGSFSTSSTDLEVRPLTLRSKRLAENFEYFYNELNDLEGSRSLNWPDIHRYFSSLTINAIDDTTKYTEGQTNKYVKEAQDFFIKVRDKLQGVDSVNGIDLFK